MNDENTNTEQPKLLMDCSKVLVVQGDYGASARAAVDIAEGEMVEFGIVRRLDGLDGMKNEYVFTWSDDIPNTTWALGSGCATFYDTEVPEKSNTHMTRFFDEDRFEIHATRPIKKGEALTHTYKSLKWRGCWDELRGALDIEKDETPM